jgi:predicted amidophosphoribosyltransferase
LGKTIVLIDDVTTTGSTLEACAKALKKEGAKTIVGLTLARAVSTKYGFSDFISNQVTTKT